MKEIQGNMFTEPCDALCITTNGVVKKDGSAVMGAGCAKKAKKKWQSIDIVLGTMIKKHGNRLHILTQTSDRNEIYIISTNIVVRQHLCAFPTKHHFKDLSDLSLIQSAANQLASAANLMQWNKIVIPKPGCGLGGLNWDDVKIILEPIWDDRFYVIDRVQNNG